MSAPSQTFSTPGSTFDAYLQLDDTPGESLNDKHKDWIEILSFTHDINQPVSTTRSSAGGAATGRASHGDFVFTAFVDKSYPKLALAASTGKPAAKAKLEVCRAGGGQVVFLTVNFEEVLISKVSMEAASSATDAHGDQLPLVNFSLNYGKIEWVYTQQKRKDGSGGGNVTAKYDLTVGK